MQISKTSSTSSCKESLALPFVMIFAVLALSECHNTKKTRNFSCLMVIIRTTFCIFGYQSRLPVFYQVFTKRKTKNFSCLMVIIRTTFCIFGYQGLLPVFCQVIKKITQNFSCLMVIIRTTFCIFGYQSLDQGLDQVLVLDTLFWARKGGQLCRNGIRFLIRPWRSWMDWGWFSKTQFFGECCLRRWLFRWIPLGTPNLCLLVHPRNLRT